MRRTSFRRITPWKPSHRRNALAAKFEQFGCEQHDLPSVLIAEAAKALGGGVPLPGRSRLVLEKDLGVLGPE